MTADDCGKVNHFRPPYVYPPKFRSHVSTGDQREPCSTPPQHDERNRTSYNQKSEQAPSDHGLLEFRKWWELVPVDIAINGELISGMPIFIKGNTLRVINYDYSYFIPLSRVDYIRTDDGLRTCSRPPKR